jgi:hypothetical protein
MNRDVHPKVGGDVMITLPRWTWTCTILFFFFIHSIRAHATRPLFRADSRTMTRLLVSDSFLGQRS